MSPNKLFDYLDGKLPAREREELEQRIAGDATLQRELAIARKLHDGMRDSSEVIDSIEQLPGTVERGAILGRRIAFAVIVLVFVNVVIGLWFIFLQQKKPASASRRDEKLRQQLEQSAQRAAVTALPTPSLESDEITIAAAPAEGEAMVSKVIAAATAAGGSGAKTLSDENGIVVLVDIPKSREVEFRDRILPLGAHLPTLDRSAKPAPPNERKFLQIRIMRAPAENKS
jgi:anti-sigma factor RsiW